MRRWLLPIYVFILCFLSPSLAGAEPFLTAQGPIMQSMMASRVIVVNEMSIFVDPSTPITDTNGRSLTFRQLNRGRWVSVEVEPDEASGFVAKRVVLLSRK